MFSHLSNNLKGILLAFGGFTAFAFGDVALKITSSVYPPFTILGCNALVSMTLLVLFAPKLGGWRRTFRTNNLKVHLARMAFNTLTGVLAVLTLADLPLPFFYTIMFITPFVASILSIPVFGDRVSGHQWLVILAGFSGVLVVLRPGLVPIEPAVFYGLLMTVILSGLFLSSRMLRQDETILSLTFYPVLSNLIFGTGYMIYTSEFPAAEHLVFFAINGAMIIAGITFNTMAFRIGKTAAVSPLHYSQMVWGILFGYVVFGDVPDVWTLTGAAIIIGSGLFLIHMERRQGKQLVGHGVD